MGSFGGTENPEQPPGIMPEYAAYCVLLCPNNFKNSYGLAFYRIPKARRIRREYVRFLRNDNLNLNSDSTRICSANWDGGEKRNRTHLPSIFPWIKKKGKKKRSEATSNSRARKRNTDISCTEMNVEADSENEVLVEQIDVDTQSNNVSPTLSFCDAKTQTEITGEFLDLLEFELKSTGEKKDKLAKEKDELTRDSKRLQHRLKNPKFDISRFKEKDEDIEFYTGLPHWDALMLLYDMLHDKAQNS